MATVTARPAAGPSQRRPETTSSAARARPPARAAEQTVSAWSTATSPGWYRVWAAISVALIATFASLAATGSLLARGASATIESNTAPSLIAVQDLFASVAEANAAATVVFLSGTSGEEDRGRRNLYLDAVGRSAEQTAQVAGLIGDDERSHEALAGIASSLTFYSGGIEASRLANQQGLDGADDQLRDALNLAQTGISDSVATVTERSQDRLDRQTGSGRIVLAAAGVAGVGAVVALAKLQSGAFRRSNRVLSVPLVLATGLVVATLVGVGSGLVTRSAALRNARAGGYDSIAATSRLQSSVLELQSDLGLRLLAGTDADDGTGAGDRTEAGDSTDGLLAAIDDDVAAIDAGADSERERAVAAELAIRWDRYRAAAESIVSLADTGDTTGAAAELRGAGLSTFNGVNTTIESVLSDNRSQFSSGVAEAAAADRYLPIYSVALPVLAALAAVYGVLRRLGDYR